MTTRILAVLTDTERETFFPGELEDKLASLGDEYKRIDSLELESEEWGDILARERPDILVGCWSTPALPEDVLDRTEGRLKYVCYLAGSVKKLVSDRLIEKGLLVTNWGNSISRVVAECGLLMMIATMRRANYWSQEMHNRGGWKNKQTEFLSVIEKRVGLHGFGSISRELVKLLKPFDVDITTYSPSVPDSLLEEFGVKRTTNLEDLFSNNDIIVELAALTPKTEKLVDERLLRMIPEKGAFVNIGRGAVVDEEALGRVAQEGKLQIALDVYTKEPLPMDSPLRGLDNVFMLPHLGGPSWDRRQDSAKLGIKNIQRFLKGESMEGVISPEVYSRTT